MCARFSLAEPGRIADRYPQFRMRAAWPPRYNIAPTQEVLAVRNDGAQELTSLRWGLIPAWAKDCSAGASLINARAETLAEKPAFRGAFQRRRCLIFADGFYEWSGPKGRKQPHHFSVGDGAPFAFAGLWERWGPKDAPVTTCAIVTCAPNALLARFHDRMPAILDDAALDAWLHGDAADAIAALVPYDAARMRSNAVTPLMNHHAFEDPRCVEPVVADAGLF